MPTTLLMECHGRIRQFCGGLTALAALGEAELRQPAAVNTAAQCARYFREALPLHAQDEDESVLPWLKEQAVLQPVLATMQQEHRQIEVLIPDVVAVLEQIAALEPPPVGFSGLAARFVALLTAQATPAAPRFAPLTGGTAVWVFMSVEVATFCMFMLNHAWGWQSDPTVFAESQALLHVSSGVRGTIILLVGSWLAYQGMLANAQDQPERTAAWMGAGAVAGLAFTINKIAEYASPELASVTLSTNAFWFSYLFLTVLHLLHVIAGVVVLGTIAVRARAGDYGSRDALTIEAAAAYWHLVDVVWVLLFPVLYLVHP